AVGDQGGGVGVVQFVLGGAGHCHLAGDVPDAAAFDVLGAAAPVGVDADAGSFDFLDLLDQLDVDACFVVDVAVGVRAGHDGGPELVGLFHRVDGDVAGPGDDHPLALEGVAAGVEHFVDEVGGAVAGGFGADLGTTEGQVLAGQHPGLVAVGDSLVLADEVADVAPARPDVAGRHVGVFTDVALQFGHEALAEPHDLAVGAPLGIEVRAALAAADGQAGEGVFENL